jgi:hypothetical protein
LNYLSKIPNFNSIIVFKEFQQIESVKDGKVISDRILKFFNDNKQGGSAFIPIIIETLDFIWLIKVIYLKIRILLLVSKQNF